MAALTPPVGREGAAFVVPPVPVPTPFRAAAARGAGQLPAPAQDNSCATAGAAVASAAAAAAAAASAAQAGAREASSGLSEGLSRTPEVGAQLAAATPTASAGGESPFAVGSLLAALQETPVQAAEQAPRPKAVSEPPTSTPSGVGLAYDATMELHEGGKRHPERPERLSALYARLREEALCQRMAHVSPRLALDSELLLCHSPEHLSKVASYFPDMDERHGPAEEEGGEREPEESVASTTGRGDGAGSGSSSSSSSSSSEENCLVESKPRYDHGPTTGQRYYSDMVDTFYNANTERAARFAAGCVTECALRVARGQLASAAAVVRPPGHHAECARAMGFCYYNNTAVAARAAIEAGLAKRVLIVDWDVHHGNGIQNILYERDDVMYVSLHRYGEGFYPGTGAAGEMGKGQGAGFTLNVPWTKKGLRDVDYMAALDLIVLPVAEAFAPDLVIAAAGFDAAAGDPLGGMELTPGGYAAMTRRLMSLAGGKLVLALEGGYNTEVTSKCFAACVAAMLDNQPQPRASGVPRGLRLRKNSHTAKLLWELSRTLCDRWGEVLGGDDYEARFATYYKGGGPPLVAHDSAEALRRSARSRLPSARMAARDTGEDEDSD